MMRWFPKRRARRPRETSSSRPLTVEALEGRRLLSAGDLDTTFGPAGTGLVTADLPGSTSEYGWSIVVQPDGKVVAAGQRQLFADPLGDFIVARYNTDGTFDASFGGGDGYVTIDFDGRKDFAYAVALAPGNKIVVAGYTALDITDAGADFAVARLNANGTIDTSFGPDGTGKAVVDFWGGSDYAWDVAARADGGVVAAGYSLSGSGAERTSNLVVAALDPDGSLDADFNGSGLNYASVGLSSAGFSVEIDSRQRVVVGGTVRVTTTDDDFLAVRYNPDGSPDTTFSGDGVATLSIGSLFATRDVARDIALYPSDAVILAGESTNAGSTDFAVAVLSFSGVPSITFGGGDGKTSIDFGGTTASTRTNDTAVDVSVLSGGALVVSGTSTNQSSGAETAAFTKLTPQGVLDTTFDGDGRATNGRGYVYDAEVAPDWDIVTLGIGSVDVGSSPDFAVARRTSDAQFDPSFGPGGADGDGVVTTDFTGPSLNIVRDIVPLPGGKTLILGRHWTGLGSNNDALLARYNSDGTPDTTFGPAGGGFAVLRTAGRDVAQALAVQSDGRILVAGYRDGTSVVVSRFTADGLPDTTYGAGGEVVFSAFETLPVQDSLDLGFAVQGDDKVLLGATVWRNRTDHMAVARLLRSGAPDPTFGGGDGVAVVLVNEATPSAVAMAPGGKIVVAGPQSSNRGAAVIRLSPDGSLDTTFSVDGRAFADFGVGTEMNVGDVVVDPIDGSIVVGGSTKRSGANTANTGDFALVKFAPDGTLDASFGDGGRVRTDFFENSDAITDLVAMPGGSLVAVGTARRPTEDGTGTTTDFALARYTPAGELDAAFGAAGDGKVTTDFGHADAASAAALDGEGRIVAGGSAFFPGRTQDLALARYEGLGGPAVAEITAGFAAPDPGFLAALGAGELRGTTVSGAGSDSYRLSPAPADPTPPLPWVNADRVSVRFVGPTDTFPVRRDMLRVSGVTGGEYAVRDFAFDPATRVATWTLAAPVAADRLRWEVDIDGDSDHELSGRFNVLAGDVDRDGMVNALDLGDIKRRLSSAAGSAGYSPFADLNADGRISALDVAALKQRLSRRLPAEPVAPAAVTSATVRSVAGAARKSVTQEFFDL